MHFKNSYGRAFVPNDYICVKHDDINNTLEPIQEAAYYEHNAGTRKGLRSLNAEDKPEVRAD